MWIKAKNKASKKLKETQLKKHRALRFETLLRYNVVLQDKRHSTSQTATWTQKLETTLIYTQLVNFKEEDQFYSATAKTVDETRKLLEQGFEHVTEIDGVKIFRKPK